MADKAVREYVLPPSCECQSETLVLCTSVDRCMHYDGELSVPTLHVIVQSLDGIGGYVSTTVTERSMRVCLQTDHSNR